MTFYPGIETNRVRVADRTVTWYDSAPEGGRGETIVLVHGTGGTAVNNFWALLPMLAMRHRVVAFDFVDPGDETAAHESYVAQARAVVDAVGTDLVHVVGYSFGAVIAASLTARIPHRVASLTLVAGWMTTDTHQRLRNTVWQQMYASGHGALGTFTLLLGYSRAYLNARTPAEIDQLVHNIETGPDRAAKMRYNRTVDISAEVATISTPTLVVGCTEDQMVHPGHSKLLFGAIADSRYVEIDSGHAVVHERPAELFTIIDRFVTEPTAHRAGTTLAAYHP